MKIGGGILRDKSCFERVVSVIKKKQAEKKKVIAVLSALYGVTDFLINSIPVCVKEEDSITKTLSKLKEMHLNYLKDIESEEVRKQAEFSLNEKISVLERFLYGIHYLKEISPRSKDLVQSFGERLSPIVLEAFLKDNGIDAEFIDAEEAGILCKGPFENAVVELNKTSVNLKKKTILLEKKVLLLPGYYGIDENNDVKTFGRGGTDYSAGFIANIFDAKLEIWKDVSGFMTADPKVVETAKQIDFLNYTEAEELGYLGAKILHPKTIKPLREKSLFAEIKNLFEPEKKGTIVGEAKIKSAEIVKSIAVTKDIAIISFSSVEMVNSSGFAAWLFSKLAEGKISIDLISTSETTISFSVSAKDLDRALLLVNELKKETECNISFKKDLSLIGVVGEGMRETTGISGRLFSALGNNKINIELISQGASEINISLVVKKPDLEKAIKLIHEEFIG